MIQRVKKPIKFCWLFSAMCIIAFAVVLQLLKWSLPYLNSFNQSISAYASKQVNAQVSLGHISSSWTGLRPKVVVDDLIINSHEGQTLLAIKQASMQLDILRSLYHWVPVWRSVEAEEVQLHVNQNAEGGWSIGGLSPAQGGDRSSWRYRSPSALFLMAGDVDLKSSKVVFTLHDQRQVKTDIPIISIQNNGHFHRLNAKAAIGEHSAFNFILEGVGDPALPDQFFAQAYLRLNRFPVERLAQLLGQVTTGVQREESEQVAESEANVELWFDFASPSRFLMNGGLELINEKSSDFAKKYYLDIPVRAEVSGDYSIKTGLSVGLRDIEVDERLALQKAHVHIHDKKLNIAIDNIDVGRWVSWGEERLIRSEKLSEVIKTLSPAGELNNLYSTVDLLKPLDFELKANVVGGQTKAWRGAPAFEQVNGYLEVGFDKGFVVLDTRDFSFFPDEVYAAPLLAEQASGYVSWALDYDKKRVKLSGYELQMRGDYGEANGHFLLDLGWKNRKDSKNLILQLGLKNSNALFHKQLVPELLPESLMQWMDEAIRAGKVEQAGLFFRGGLHSGTEKSIQFFADVEQGGLDFSSDWPALSDLNGRLLIDNQVVTGTIKQAAIYKGDKFKGRFAWNERGDGHLAVKAKGTSGAQSGLRYLRESWLKNKVGDFVNQVSGKGRLGLDVDLLIPLEDTDDSGKQDVLLTLKNNQLNLEDVDLQFSSVNGSLRYTSEAGFTSKGLRAELFEKQVTAKVESDTETGGVMVTGGGVVDVKPLADWLELPVLSFASGTLDYQVGITLPADDAMDEPGLVITSNLLGVEAKLPQQFNKKADQPLESSFVMPFTDGERTEFTVTLGQYFSGHFALEEDKPLIATIAVSDVQYPELTSLPEQGVKLVSQFHRFDAKEWFYFFQQYPEDEESAYQAVDAFLSIDEFAFGEHHLNNIMVSGHREQSGWSLFVDSDDVLGGVYIDDDTARPLIVDVDYLHWPPVNLSDNEDVAVAAEPVAETSWLDDVDPRSVPAANIKINRLVYKGKPLGNWSMELRPDNEGLSVNNIIATVNGFTLSGDMESKGASLQWRVASDAEPESTSFTGMVFGKNPKNLFEQWGLPFGLESEETQVNASLSWQGSPMAFSVESLEGKMNTYNKKGIFVQEKTNEAVGILKLFGVLNFDSWARRVRLDFSDVYKKGLVFDELKSELTFNRGIIELSEPLTMQGPSSKMSLSGTIDYPAQSVDARLVATLPIGGNLTVVAALAGGLPAAAGVYLVSKLFEKQVEKVSSVNYLIRGDWSDPLISVEKLGDEDVTSSLTESES